ncbi:prepilin-type N-terminal cleavage/methylation domain-containing protein [Paraglaciecola sp.]|uniref:prepilin-type N-terminal cleavage/methylation domain-containing protein n=1 Tax=Paraglaciecola sp. TaxID=1920173 RepID=UPI003EF31EC1
MFLAKSKCLQRGFTLMEVLIAGLILFMAISTTTLIYRSAMMSSLKAEKVITINGFVPFAVEDIEIQIREAMNPQKLAFEGEGELLDITYTWQANQLLAKGATPRLGFGTNELIIQPPRYKLWRVNLTMTYSGMSRQFSYTEFSFQELQ